MPHRRACLFLGLARTARRGHRTTLTTLVIGQFIPCCRCDLPLVGVIRSSHVAWTGPSTDSVTGGGLCHGVLRGGGEGVKTSGRRRSRTKLFVPLSDKISRRCSRVRVLVGKRGVSQPRSAQWHSFSLPRYLSTDADPFLDARNWQIQPSVFFWGGRGRKPRSLHTDRSFSLVARLHPTGNRGGVVVGCFFFELHFYLQCNTQ